MRIRTEETGMNDGWIVLGIIVIFMLGAALPLLRKDQRSNTPLPPAKETLRDWRNEK
jgi:hypothetical protein